MINCSKKWIEKLIDKYGENFSFPPYPRELVYPDFIKQEWIYKSFMCNDDVPTLYLNEMIKKMCIGDQFNAVVFPKKRGKGLKKSTHAHRIFQFAPDFNV